MKRWYTHWLQKTSLAKGFIEIARGHYSKTAVPIELKLAVCFDAPDYPIDNVLTKSEMFDIIDRSICPGTICP